MVSECNMQFCRSPYRGLPGPLTLRRFVPTEQFCVSVRAHWKASGGGRGGWRGVVTTLIRKDRFPYESTSKMTN